MKKTINVGLIGFGNVGRGVYELLHKNGVEIERRTGFRPVIKKIGVKSMNKKRPLAMGKGIFTSNIDEILNDDEIQVVVELIGGYSPAKKIILKALRNGKHVVTANKALLARSGMELFEEANRNGASIYLEGAVGGAIPIVLPMGLSLSANKIQSIYGILNGTCNYILTKMTEEGIDYADALKQAQEKGFAERNPRLDVEGIDTMHKIAILSSIAFGTRVEESDVYVEGITGITQQDLRYAAEQGYVIKLLAIAKEGKDGLEIRVHPTMIPKTHPIAAVRNEFNGITINGNFSGELTFQGRGAGGNPTASAVVSDIINVAHDIASKPSYEFRLIRIENIQKRKIRKIGQIESHYYIRLSVLDRPGVLAKIAKALAVIARPITA